MSELIAQLVALESDVAYDRPASENESEFRYIPGTAPVLLSAPHAAMHRRSGRTKPEEAFTAGFARFIGRQTDAHVLYARHKSQRDPNWHRDSPYKEQLGRIVAEAGIRFVLDLHTAAPRWQFGLALGTMEGRSCPRHEALIIQTLESYGFTPRGRNLDGLAVNHPRFTGGVVQWTVTRYASSALNVPAAQIELNAQYLWIRQEYNGASEQTYVHAAPWRLERAAHACTALVEELARTRP